MKKTAIFVIGALLFCGGFFCFHLTAQTAKIGDSFSQKDKSSLLQRKFEECSERELLELKVAAHQKIVANVAVHNVAGSPYGTATRLAESQANVAAAEIELYRHTGEQDKLRIALKTRIEHLTEKLRAEVRSYEAGATHIGTLYEVEIQLLDALLEQKREKQ